MGSEYNAGFRPEQLRYKSLTTHEDNCVTLGQSPNLMYNINIKGYVWQMLQFSELLETKIQGFFDA